MARFPCDRGPHRYRGPQQTIYIGIVKGTESQRYKLRLCPHHFSAAQDYLAEFKVDPVDGTCAWFGTGAKCVACLQPMDELGWQFFSTVYPTNDEREDYWGGLHDRHDPPSALAVPDGIQPMGPRRPVADVGLEWAVVSQTLAEMQPQPRKGGRKIDSSEVPPSA